MQRALTGADFGSVAIPFLVDTLGGEVPFDQVRSSPVAPAGPGGRPAPSATPRGEALLAHQRRDGVLAHRPPRIAEVCGDPGRAVGALVSTKQPADLDFQPFPTRRPRWQHP